MNNSNITTNPTNAASASVTNKVILNMTNNLYGSSSPLTSQINMISNLQKSAFQTTTAKPNATLIPLHNSVPTSIATNLSTPITLVPANQATTPAGMNSPSSSAYGGFAHCSNCGDYGVKAAFYGKSKLYCSVACQNGIKKQQQSQQGTKRTIESLNYSNSSSVNNSPVMPNSSPIVLNPITTTQQVVSHAPVNLSNPVITASLTSQIIPVHTEASMNLQQEKTTTSNTVTLLSSQNVITTNDTASKANSINTNQQSIPPVQQNASEHRPVLLATETTTASNPATSPNQNIHGNASKRARNDSNSTLSTITNLNLQSNKQNSNKPESLPDQCEDVKPSIASLTATKSAMEAKSTKNKFQWSTLLDMNMKAAPVHFFKNIPLRDFWIKLKSNIIVEVPNSVTPSSDEDRYWFAQITRCEGYLVKLRYIGYEDDSQDDFWMHLCDKKLHPIGWSNENDITLTPPKRIEKLREPWRNYLLEKMVGLRTLPKDIHQKITKSKETKFKKGMLLELLDRNKVSFMRIARIIDNIGGRLQLRYEGFAENSDDFWCNELSDLIHPIGWSAFVGHQINATEDYKKKSLIKFERNLYEPNECSPDMFKDPNDISKDSFNNQKLLPFKKNMKLEAVDPLNLSKICVATVAKVLKNNYLMIRIDGFKAEDDSDLFCYHQTSSSLFPAGFCQRNSLNLHYFGSKKKGFNWKKYLNETSSQFAPNELFNVDPNLQNPFKPGMKLESVDIIDPSIVCVATVIAVVNRLLRIHFDGWDSDYDQWVDFESDNLFPVGWCEFANFPLTPPNAAESEKSEGTKAKKKTNVL